MATAKLSDKKIDLAEQSRLSRQGSGSSCRSFFAPWSIWRGDGGEGAHIDLNLDHAVVIVEDRPKEVSSSDAHVRVTSSRLFEGRKRRAEERLDQFVKALQSGEWKQAYEVCWPNSGICTRCLRPVIQILVTCSPVQSKF